MGFVEKDALTSSSVLSSHHPMLYLTTYGEHHLKSPHKPSSAASKSPPSRGWRGGSVGESAYCSVIPSLGTHACHPVKVEQRGWFLGLANFQLAINVYTHTHARTIFLKNLLTDCLILQG